MSKRSRKKARKRRQVSSKELQIHCPDCHSRAEMSQESLLFLLADVLNRLGKAGLRVRVWHGILRTYRGYIIQLPQTDEWVIRKLNFTEFSPEDDEDDLYGEDL